jgi:hypothetical protein
MENILSKILEVLQKMYEWLMKPSESNLYNMDIQNIGTITINAAGQVLSKELKIPDDMTDVIYIGLNTTDTDRLIKRCKVGIEINGVTFFKDNISAKIYYIPLYVGVNDRMFDLRKLSKDGKGIVSSNKIINVRYSDDASIASPAFANYSFDVYIMGHSKRFD